MANEADTCRKFVVPLFGRLEILGVPSRDIAKSSAPGNRMTVTAEVDEQLAEKAALILQAGQISGV